MACIVVDKVRRTFTGQNKHVSKRVFTVDDIVLFPRKQTLNTKLDGKQLSHCGFHDIWVYSDFHVNCIKCLSDVNVIDDIANMKLMRMPYESSAVYIGVLEGLAGDCRLNQNIARCCPVHGTFAREQESQFIRTEQTTYDDSLCDVPSKKRKFVCDVNKYIESSGSTDVSEILSKLNLYFNIEKFHNFLVYRLLECNLVNIVLDQYLRKTCSASNRIHSLLQNFVLKKCKNSVHFVSQNRIFNSVSYAFQILVNALIYRLKVESIVSSICSKHPGIQGIELSKLIKLHPQQTELDDIKQQMYVFENDHRLLLLDADALITMDFLETNDSSRLRSFECGLFKESLFKITLLGMLSK